MQAGEDWGILADCSGLMWTKENLNGLEFTEVDCQQTEGRV